jgi:hypothetical protein
MIYALDQVDQRLSGLPTKQQLTFYRLLARNYEFNRIEGQKGELAAVARCDRKTMRHNLRRFALLGLAVYDENRGRLLVNPWLVFRGAKDDHRRACDEWLEHQATVPLRVVE